MKKSILLFIAATLIFVFTSIAKAELLDRGNGLVYDDVMDITWLQNANYAGITMTWIEASKWAEDLNYNGYVDWRLPESDPSCISYDCTNSEMGHLYYGDDISSDSPGLFTEVRSFMYWSGTDYDEDTSKAWRFHFNSGYQGTSAKTYSRYAWAVRDGDSGLPVAPEPISSLLFVTGSITLAASRYWKKRKNC